jgi:hypothetical protein
MDSRLSIGTGITVTVHFRQHIQRVLDEKEGKGGLIESSVDSFLRSVFLPDYSNLF